MSDISFAREWLLLFLPIAPLALAAWWWGSVRARRRAAVLSRTRSAAPPYAAAVLFSLAVVIAVLAAAQPRWGTRESKVPRNGSDLVVVLDISRSMDARDVAPSRLQAAKATIDTITDRLGGDRIGLVVFAGEARVRFPVTTDFSAARQVVDSVESGVIFVKGGTDASLGLEEAVQLLSEDKSQGKVILLLTDGDDLGGDPTKSAEAVRNSGATLLVAGIGTADGGPIPIQDPATRAESLKLDSDGQPIITKLNEVFLRALAAASGGRYIGSDLSTVPGSVEGRLRALQATRLDERPTFLPIERYRGFAAAALALLVLGTLAERFARFPMRAGLAVGLLALLAVLASACASDAYSANEAGRTALKNGDADLAIQKFLDAQTERPDDPEIALNLATAYEAAGRHEEAILSARRATLFPDSGVRNRGYAAEGHGQFGAGRLTDALDAFKHALLEDPGDDASRHDFEVVLRLLVPGADPTATATAGTGSPSPEPSGSGGASPSPGGSGGSPTAPAGTPTPNGGSGNSGSATQTPGTVTSLQELERQLRDIDQNITRILESAGEVPSVEQAQQILRLLAERNRIAQLRNGLNGGGGPRDY
jgi:Ca-activated chloride channel family protein